MNLSLQQKIVWLKRHGSSLSMNYGEDTGAWEVAWMSGDTRLTATDIHLHRALDSIMVSTYYAMLPEHWEGEP